MIARFCGLPNDFVLIKKLSVQRNKKRGSDLWILLSDTFLASF